MKGGSDREAGHEHARQESCDEWSGIECLPYLAWWERQREERQRRKERSGKTLCGLALAEGLLAFLVLAHAVADHRSGTRTWRVSQAETYAIHTVVQLLPELPALDMEIRGEPGAPAAREVLQPQAAQRQRANETSGDHVTSTFSEAIFGGGVSEREDATSAGRQNAVAGEVKDVLLAGRPQRVEPEAAKTVSAPVPANITLELAPPPEMGGGEALEQPPALRSETLHLEYPRDAQKKGAEGLVVLHFYVDEKGRISAVKVLSSPHPSLDRAAVDALYAARFTPGRDGDRNVGSFTRLGVRFRLR